MPEHLARSDSTIAAVDPAVAFPGAGADVTLASSPYPEPTGPAMDLAYAAHYADAPASLADLCNAFVAAARGPAGRPHAVTALPENPKLPKGPEKPEAPEVGEDGRGLGPHRESEDADGKHDDAYKAEFGGRLRAGRTTTRPDGDGSSASASIGRGGIRVSGSTTKGDKTTDMGARVNPVSGEQAVSLSHGSEQRKVAVTAGTKDGTTTLGGSVKVGPVSVHGGVRTTNQVTQGEIGSEGIDATIREFVGGGGSYVEQHKGFGADGGGDVEYGPFGAGGGGSVASDTKRRHFRAGGAEETKLPATFPGLAPQTPAELDGKNDIADVDVDKLQRGEGYSFEHSRQSGQEGHAKVILSVGLAHDESAVTDTVIARDGRGDLRVMVAQADESAIRGGVSAGDKVSIGGKATEGKSASVSFTAHGPEGERAVKEFQATGLLPGADEAAKLANPDAFAGFDRTRREWRETLASAKQATGEVAVYLQRRLNDLQAELTAAAGPLNEAFLQRPGDLPAPKGVSYDDHTTLRQSSDERSLGALGHEVIFGGHEEAEWERGYRDGGKAHLEQGFEREDKHLIKPNETSQIVTDPKGFAKDGDPVALVMGGKQPVSQKQRDVLAKVGGEAFDMPPETLEAWRTGKMTQGQLAEIAVTLTEGQLAKMRDTIAKPNVAETALIAGGVRGLHDAAGKDALALHGELDQLYRAAAAARFNQLMDAGKFDPGTILDHGMSEMLAHVESVKTPEDFVKLTPEEQKLVVATGAITMRDEGQSAFECMRLVVQVKDRDQRNALMRQLFETNERREEGADGAVDFLKWVESSGLPPDEIKELTAGVSVRMEDKGREAASYRRAIVEAAVPGAGANALGERLASEAAGGGFCNPLTGERREVVDADRVTDLLQAARDGGDRATVERAMSAAMAKDPAFLGKMWATLAKDPARLAWANHMLEGTMYHRVDLGKP